MAVFWNFAQQPQNCDRDTYLMCQAITPVYAEPNRELSEAHKMADGHARSEAKVWLGMTRLLCLCDFPLLFELTNFNIDLTDCVLHDLV